MVSIHLSRYVITIFAEKELTIPWSHVYFVADIYVGRVVGVNADRQTWDVVYEDGEEDFGLCHTCVWSFVPYALDDEVDVRTHADEFSAATVVAVHGFGSYDVRVKGSGKLFRKVGFSSLRRFDHDKMGPEVGDRVEGLLEDEWFPGTVHKVHNGGESYAISYDDGDFENNVPRNSVRALIEED